MNVKAQKLYLRFFFPLLAGLIFLFSCSRTEPRIPFGFIELTYYPTDGQPQERFSFFVIAEDDDGIENLSELQLINDREGLEWILGSKDWVHHEDNGRHWIGSRSIAMTGGDVLPRGLYRAVLVNKGGEKTEYSLTFDAPAAPRYPFPVLQISEGYYSINSLYPDNTFIAYDNQGNFLRTAAVPNLEGSIASVNIPNNTRFLALWTKDSEYHTSALTEAQSIR